MKRFWRLIPLSVIIIALLLPFGVAKAQIPEPDAGFTINQVEAYRDALYEDGQLYLITATIDYNTSPLVYDVSEAFIVTLRDVDNLTILGTTTFYAFSDSGRGYDYGMSSILFDPASAPPWNQAYHVHIDGNPSLHWLDTTAVHSMTGVWYYDYSAGTYADETADANNAVANDVSIPPDAMGAEEDTLYLGSSGMFDLVTVNVGTVGNWGGTYAWEYWNGTEWTAVSALSDSTAGFTIGTGISDITYDCPIDWQAYAVNGVTLYWLRFRIVAVTAHVAQPLGTQFWTNTLDSPPHIETDVFSLWYDGGSVSSTRDRLTTRLRALAVSFENDWGIAIYNLIDDTAAGKKLTIQGEEYFTNAISNLRDMCPDLFSAVLTTPDFTEYLMIDDAYMGGADLDYDVYGANNIYAQTFTATSNYEWNGSWIRLYRVGANPGNVALSLRNTAAGLPTGADLVAGTLNGNTFSTSTGGVWYQITSTDDYELTIGTVYAVVVQAATGGVANYVAWLADSNNGYADGQACFYNGAIWAAAGGGVVDFMFGNTATSAYSMSYRDRMASRLIGTPFDMTAVATAISPHLSRMMVTGMAFFTFFMLPVTVFAVRAARTYKIGGFTMSVIALFAIPAGFLFLEIGVVMALVFGAVGIWTLFLRGAP